MHYLLIVFKVWQLGDQNKSFCSRITKFISIFLKSETMNGFFGEIVFPLEVHIHLINTWKNLELGFNFLTDALRCCLNIYKIFVHILPSILWNAPVCPAATLHCVRNSALHSLVVGFQVCKLPLFCPNVATAIIAKQFNFVFCQTLQPEICIFTVTQFRVMAFFWLCGLFAKFTI